MAKTTNGPVYRDADTIVKLLDNQEKNVLGELYSRMERHYDLYSGKRYRGKKGYKSYTSPAPRNHFDKIGDGLIRSEMNIQIETTPNPSDDEKEQASLGEDYLFGALGVIDRNQRARNEPPLKESMIWYEDCRGWIASSCLVYIDKDDTLQFDVRAWDLMHTRWDQSYDGLLWAAYEYPITKGEALDRYGKKIAGTIDEGQEKDYTTIIDFFDRTNHCQILRSTKKFLKRPTPHYLNRVPVFIGSVGNMPHVFKNNWESTLVDRGDSVFTTLEYNNDAINEVISLVWDLCEKERAGSLLHYSKGGRKTIKGDPHQNFQEIPLDTNLDEDIKPLPRNQMPIEASFLIQEMSKDKEESRFPAPIGFGIDPARHSGTAISQLQEGMRSHFSPRSQLLETYYEWLCEELLAQFADKGVDEVTFQGYNRKGEFFKRSIAPEAIDPNWFVKVTIAPRMPRDTEAEIGMAIAARQPGGMDGSPLLDDFTILNNLLKTQAPERIQDRKEGQFMDNLPIVRIKKLADRLVEEHGIDPTVAVQAATQVFMPPQQPQQGVM